MARHLIIMCLQACLVCAACTDQNALVGTYQESGARLESVDSSVSGSAYRLSLMQFNHDVAGVIRIYRFGPDEPWNTANYPWEAETYCTRLENGSFFNDTVSFTFVDEIGVQYSMVLTYQDDGSLALSGTVNPVPSGLSPDIAFTRLQTDVDKTCVHYSGSFEVEVIFSEDFEDMPETARIGLIFTGQTGGAPYYTEYFTSYPVTNWIREVIVMRSKPDQREVVEGAPPEYVKIGFAFFVVYDDTNGDGLWGRYTYTSEDNDERMLGLATRQALVYMDGDLDRFGDPTVEQRFGMWRRNFGIYDIETDVNGSVTSIVLRSDEVRINQRVQDEEPALPQLF